MPAAVTVADLTKTYYVPVRGAGLRAALKALVSRETRAVTAVADLSFTIDAGEVVGFLGPNGAGKTTTLKMLSGLLQPSSGTATVLGATPGRREAAFLSRIALVMGNRNQLQWDLPALDSFALNQAIYRIPDGEFRRMRDELIALFDVERLVTQPVRNLSLGERMKMEIIGALLHRPQVLYLDEPTIGLDVTMQQRIRSFIADYNRRYDATVLLTSHYMADVEALCKRVIVIHHGRLLFDGALQQLVSRFSAQRRLTVTLAAPADLSRFGTVVAQDGERITLELPRADTPRLTAQLLAETAVLDLTVSEPPIEDAIARVFALEEATLEAGQTR
jgi:ABC-2 type transport system ATP-binding protein